MKQSHCVEHASCARVITALLSVFLLFASMAVCSADWIRFFAGRPSDSPGIRFGLSSTQEEANRGLSANAWYRYREGNSAVTLHGEKEVDGTFRPIIIYEVAAGDKTKWKKIDVRVEQPSSERIIVGSEHPSAALSLNMEPFRSAIGTYKYGRLVLENGDAVVFSMDDLLPTDATDSRVGNFKIDTMQSDEEKKKEGFSDAWLAEPAIFVSVISVGGRMMGDFVFDNRSRQVASLEGSRSLDGDFCPNLTLQVADSDGNWKTIGKSQSNGISEALQIQPGKAERIRVLLDDYRPLIGRFRYGRVLFSNGQSGIFYLDLLKPK